MLSQPRIMEWPVQVMEPENWQPTEPQRGDHIRVNRGLYYHHGIFVSFEEVIHFASLGDDNLLGSNNEVIATDLSSFLRDGQVERKIYTAEEQLDLYPVDHIVHFARTYLGDGGYNVVFNNCEHFANYCTLGRFRSQQVENVLLGQKGGAKMGFLGKIGDWIGGIFGGSRRSSSSTSTTTNTTTTYEPDKVQAAEIERSKALQLARIDQENIELRKQAEIELMQMNTQMEMAVVQAKARGFEMARQAIMAVMREANVLAEQQFAAMEQANLTIVKEINTYYGQIEQQINLDKQEFNMVHLPQMLNLLEKYSPGSAAYELYHKNVDQQIASEVNFVKDQIERVRNQQQKLLDSAIEQKDKLYEQTHALVEQRLAQLESRISHSSLQGLSQGKASDQKSLISSNGLENRS